MAGGSKRSFRFPTCWDVDRRGRESIYVSADRCVICRLGVRGAEMDACAGGGTPEAIARVLSKKWGRAFQDVLPAVDVFVEKMIHDGFFDRANRRHKSPQIQVGPQPLEPLILYLHLTDDCNQACIYCYNADIRRAPGKARSLTLTEHRKALAEWAGIGARQVIFTGGEPLLSPFWRKLAAEVKSHGMSLSLLTNGTLIDRRSAEDLRRHFTQVIVSLDSPERGAHEAARGRGTFARTVEGIRNLGRAGHPGVLLRAVLHRGNLDTIHRFPLFAKSMLGYAQFEMSLYVPNRGETSPESHLPSIEAYGRALSRFEEALAEVGGTSRPACSSPRATIRCGAASQVFSVSPQGDIFPCQSLHDDALCMGNVRMGNILTQLERSSTGRALRKLHVYKVKQCRDCGLNFVCGGGCRAIAWKLFGSWDAFNPYHCAFNAFNAWEHLWEATKPPERAPSSGPAL